MLLATFLDSEFVSNIVNLIYSISASINNIDKASGLPCLIVAIFWIYFGAVSDAP